MAVDRVMSPILASYSSLHSVAVEGVRRSVLTGAVVVEGLQVVEEVLKNLEEVGVAPMVHRERLVLEVEVDRHSRSRSFWRCV